VADWSASAERLRYQQAKERAFTAFRRSEGSPRIARRHVEGLLSALSKATDQALLRLWRHAALPPGASLVAVGGYGRAEQFPHSDVDVLILMPDGAGPEAAASAERFVGLAWDLGLEMGSSVRTVAECITQATADVTVQTALLESRCVGGDLGLYQRFQEAFWVAMNPRAFLVAKTLEMRQRHQKFEDTPYSLEPNCKESPGGLRDLQLILWIAKAARLGNTWAELASNGLLTPYEARQLKQNDTLLKTIRARLHLAAGRREDRLVFDLQSIIAQTFGYLPDVSPDGRARSVRRVSEQLMRRYYWAAKAVSQLNQILLLNIEERLSPQSQAILPLVGADGRPIERFAGRFGDKAGSIEILDEALYQHDKDAILQTFVALQAVPGARGLSARTLRALYNARSLMDARFRASPANRRAFMEILKAPSGQTLTLRAMNATSVLGRYLWVFRRIVGQMQHDLFHVYTVDQHILMVLRNVRRFFMAEHAHEYPLCSQLAASLEDPWVLYIAALFHDIAKGRGGDHSELGSADVRAFCKQHKVDAANARLCEFLVAEHLTMSRIAQKEDLSDPAVIASFAAKVKDERTLTALYLLTVADVRGTSPKVWNAWKAKLLEDLYRYTLRALGGHAVNAEAEVEQRRAEALATLRLYGLHMDAPPPLWQSMDVGYFMRHDAGEIAWHARSLHGREASGQTVVKARLSAVGEGLQVMVYAPDQADLFVRICAYFDTHGYSIQDARIHTSRPSGNKASYGLDTFQVVATNLSGHYRDIMALVETQLTQALAQSAPLHAPGRGRVSRRVRSFPITPRVELRPDERAQRWLLSVSASDRTGLLYGIASVLARHKVNLQLAKVSTLGERVEDVFLIDGPALQQTREQIAIETELLDALKA
jgi:[protein-PII] uridylyltransferase